jgi:hypothetical protein
MRVDANGGGPNYWPYSFGGPAPDPTKGEPPFPVDGLAGRHPFKFPNDDFVQAGNLYRKVMTDQDRANLIGNIVAHLGNAQKRIQYRQASIFFKAEQLRPSGGPGPGARRERSRAPGCYEPGGAGQGYGTGNLRLIFHQGAAATRAAPYEKIPSRFLLDSGTRQRSLDWCPGSGSGFRCCLRPTCHQGPGWPAGTGF